MDAAKKPFSLFGNKKKKNEAQNKEDEHEMTFQTKTINMITQVRMIALITLVLSFSAWRDVDDMKNNARTFLAFGNTGEQVWVSGNNVSDTYAKRMAVYFATMWGTATSASVGKQHAEILTFVHPFYLDEVRRTLKERQAQFERFKTLAIYARIPVDAGLRKDLLKEHDYRSIDTPVYRVTYDLEQKRMIGDSDPKNRSVQMVFDFTVDNGRAHLLNIFEAKVKK